MWYRARARMAKSSHSSSASRPPICAIARSRSDASTSAAVVLALTDGSRIGSALAQRHDLARLRRWRHAELAPRLHQLAAPVEQLRAGIGAFRRATDGMR